MIVLTADHGDGFAEHGFLSHSNLPYHELLHVPLIRKLPGARLAGSTVSHQVRLIDLLPTLVEMATGGEMNLSEDIDGCSLLPLLTAGTADPRPELCHEAVSEMLLKGKQLTVAVREGGLSYLVGENLPPALFDCKTDPQELENLAGRGHPSEARLHRRALEVLAAARALEVERRAIDSQTLEQIRALGYLE